MNPKYWLALGGLYGFLAVALGAVGAHALAQQAGAQAMLRWHTAEDYNFHHALALLAVGLLSLTRPSLTLTLSGGCFALGVPLFCGSLYALALGQISAPLAPFGGTLLMLGWLLLGWSALRLRAP